MRFVFACLSLCAVAGPALSAPTILPGYWESQNKVSFPVSDETTSRQCITADKVDQFLSGPSSRNYKCTYAKSQVRNGSVQATGQCIDKNGMNSTIDVRGVYTPTTFKLDAELKVNVGGLGIPVRASTDAHRLSADCPAGEK